MGISLFFKRSTYFFKERQGVDNKFETLMDNLGKNIVKELEKNARISFSELGRKVGLSSPAVAERIRKMEEAGIIRGYRAVIDVEGDSPKILAFISMTTLAQHYKKIRQILGDHPGTLECHHLSGEESLMIKVCVKNIHELDGLVEMLGAYGKTRTAIVLSSFVDRPDAIFTHGR